MTRYERPYVIGATPSPRRPHAESHVPQATWTARGHTFVVGCLVAWCMASGVLLAALALFALAGHLVIGLR